MDKIIKVNFEEWQDKQYDESLKQWDQGQKLEISGLNISDEIVEVHFSLEETSGTAKRMLGTVKDGVIHAKIPAFILEGPEYTYGDTYSAWAWVYVSDEESAETIRKIEFIIEARPKPEEYVTPEELSFLQQLEEAIKNKITTPSSAKVGQFLRVKEVDENGKPIEFDVTSGTNGDVSDEQIQEAVNEYLEKNQIEVKEATTEQKGVVTLANEQALERRSKDLVLTANLIDLIVRKVFTDELFYLNESESSSAQRMLGIYSRLNDCCTSEEVKGILAAVIPNYVPYKTSQLTNDSGFTTLSDVDLEIKTHNVSTTAHNDIRLLIEGLSARLNALADSDDTTLDQMSEIVAYIKANKSLIDSITTSKVSVTDIIDNLETSVSNKPLSAKQGVVLKGLIDNVYSKNEIDTMFGTYVDEMAELLGGDA